MQRHNIDRSVLDLLPHRFPFVLLDRVLTVEPGRWAAAITNVTLDEPWVDANGELSPVFLAEAMAVNNNEASIAISAITVRSSTRVKATVSRSFTIPLISLR